MQPLLALAGTLCPFGQAEDLVQRLTGLPVSDSTCRRLTESAGQVLTAQYQQHQAVVGPPVPAWDFSLPPQEGQHFPGTVAYLGLDAFAVPTRPAQGGGIDWRMLYGGLLYDPRKEHTIYVSDYDFERVAAVLRRYAIQYELGQAETLVALTDGGHGLERVLRQAFSENLVFVLDYYHPAERLHTFGGLLHNQDPGAATAWAAQAKRVLWEEGGGGLLAWLRGVSLPRRGAAALREELRVLVGYVEANVHRMAYPEYRARGWDVGSGPTEAGCKVLGGRVKGTGMRWCVAASEQVAALRALYASGEGLWDAFWEQRRWKPYLTK